MTKRLISFLIALCIFIAIPLSARYKYNPFTRKLDYYEPVSGSDLGDLGDVTLTGLATGNVLYYNGTAWVNLATGANTNVLTLAGGVPTWAVAGAPAAHAASHEVGGADLVDHDQLTNYLAAQHLTLPNTIVAVLTDHNLAAHTALGLYDAPGDVDHDLTTNYVANQHIDHTAITFSAAGLITGGGTLAANRTFTLTEATIEVAIDSLPNLTSMQTPWTNVFVVDAGGGGDYTTIQAALNAQNAGGETFLVAPGTYADTISFTANDQVVKPLGHAANVIVTQADANIVDGGAFTDCITEGIEIRLTAPTTAINAIQVGIGTLIVIECRGYLATAVALVAADQPSLVGFTGAGTIRIKRGNYQYYHTGNTGAGGVKAAFRSNQNLAELHMHKIDVMTITNSGTALATAVFVTTGTAMTEMHNCIDVTITDPNATLVVGLGYVGGAGAHNIQGNHVDVVATNNTSYGLYHNGTATVRSAFNSIHASDAAGSSYAFFVGASATLNSHFDDLRSDDGNNNSGTLNLVSSQTDGDFTATNAFVYDRVTDHNLLVGYLAGQDITAGQGQYNTLIGEQAGTDITTGDFNVIVGYQAGFIETDIAQSTFIGYQAGYNLSGTSNNVAIGYKAMFGIAPTGYGGNTAIGTEAFTNAGEESLRNTVIGYKALEDASDEAEHITAIGYKAGGQLTTPASNSVLIGSFAGLGADGVADYEYNVIIGVDSGFVLTSGSWNTVVGNAAARSLTAGQYNVIIGDNSGDSATTADNSVFIGANAGENITVADGNVAVGYNALVGSGTSVATIGNTAIGYEALFSIGEYGAENTAVGYYALRSVTDGGEVAGENVAVGWSAGATIGGNSIKNVFIGRSAGYGDGEANNIGNTFVGYQAGEDISAGDYNIAIGYMAGEGWLDTENEKLVIDVTDTATPLIYGDFSADNITINGDFDVTMDAALDQIVIAQTAVAGTENQPLIFIDDDRTGATVDEIEEATIVIDAEGNFALYIMDGSSWFDTTVTFNASVTHQHNLIITDVKNLEFGAGSDVYKLWDTNGAGDDLMVTVTANMVQADETSAFWYGVLNPNGMTDHDNYLSPTFIIANDEAADANDYAGVVIGERTQASVLVAHYFDFYAMTGAVDGIVDPNAAELAAIFRFGPNGTGVPDNATTPGDVLFEGSIEVDGNINLDGEVFQGDYVVSQVVNFNDGSPVEICSVADGYVVTDVYVEITTIWDGTGVITIGDGDDTDGFMRDADIDQGTAAYYGWHLDERGDYLWDGPDHGDHKLYTGVDTVDATLVAGDSTQGIATVYVHITRLK